MTCSTPSLGYRLLSTRQGVIGMLDLLEYSPLSNDQQDCLQTAKRSADLLLTLIDDLLDVVRIESGKLALCPTPFSLRDHLNFVCASMQKYALDKGIHFSFTVSDNVPDCIIGDYHRISQVLNNLVNNALKFTEEGGEISTTVNLEEDHDGTFSDTAMNNEEESIVLHFTVKDSGIGIPEDMQCKIFEPFFQADLSHTKKFGGIGMGLKICSGTDHHHSQHKCYMHLLTHTNRVGRTNAGKDMGGEQTGIWKHLSFYHTMCCNQTIQLCFPA